MPKEVTHFLIAEKVMEALKKDVFWQPFLKHKNTIMLGSVFQDSLYYLSEKHSNEEIRKLPDRFHGDYGEDTFFLLKGLKTLPQENEHAVAFIIGLVSHIFADATFHPLVYYFTGNYFDRDEGKRSKAVRNHRKIEGLMDVYFCSGHTLIHSYSVAKFWNTGTDNLELFKFILQGVQMEDNSVDLPAVLQSAYRRFAKVQRYFNSLLTRNTFPYLETILSNKSKELLAVFYSAKSKHYIEKLAGEINYRNPLTGEMVQTTLESLFNDSVNRTVEFCTELKDIINGTKLLENLPIGPSLELGHPNCRVEDMKYFSEQDFF